MAWDPAPAGGLATSGNPTWPANARRLLGTGDQRVLGAGHPGLPEHGLHPRLVAHVVCRGDVHALDPQRLPRLGQRHLQLLEDADDPVHTAQLPPEPGDRVRELPWVQGVVDAPVPGELLPQRRRHPLQRLAGDQPESDVRQGSGAGHEANRGFAQIGRDERGSDHPPHPSGGVAPPTGRAIAVWLAWQSCASSSWNPTSPGTNASSSERWPRSAPRSSASASHPRTPSTRSCAAG